MSKMRRERENKGGGSVSEQVTATATPQSTGEGSEKPQSVIAAVPAYRAHSLIVYRAEPPGIDEDTDWSRINQKLDNVKASLIAHDQRITLEDSAGELRRSGLNGGTRTISVDSKWPSSEVSPDFGDGIIYDGTIVAGNRIKVSTPPYTH